MKTKKNEGINLGDLIVLAQSASKSTHTLTIPEEYVGKTILAIVWSGQSSAFPATRYANENFTNVTDLVNMSNLTTGSNIAPGTIYSMTPTSTTIVESYSSGTANHNVILLGI